MNPVSKGTPSGSAFSRGVNDVEEVFEGSTHVAQVGRSAEQIGVGRQNSISVGLERVAQENLDTSNLLCGGTGNNLTKKFLQVL